jgi:hypothetical protein
MANVRFIELCLQTESARQYFQAVADADIKSAHGETVNRPAPLDTPAYLYDAVVHDQDSDLKAHEEEIEAQQRCLRGWTPG